MQQEVVRSTIGHATSVTAGVPDVRQGPSTVIRNLRWSSAAPGGGATGSSWAGPGKSSAVTVGGESSGLTTDNRG
jgi:hypothetical protein